MPRLLFGISCYIEALNVCLDGNKIVGTAEE